MLARPPIPTDRDLAFSGWLDLFRALAAFAALFGHARALFLASASGSESLPVKILDSFSGYGYQAVMVFFVLSGYLAALCDLLPALRRFGIRPAGPRHWLTIRARDFAQVWALHPRRAPGASDNLRVLRKTLHGPAGCPELSQRFGTNRGLGLR